jgi:hypothetical protein
MKTKKTTTIIKSLLFVITAFIITVSLNSCSKKISFLTSSVVPAARGTVKIKKDNNNNYDIDIDLFNLAESKRLEPPKQAYVVWMETNENLLKNIGQINSSTGFLTQKLKANFNTVSAAKPVRIFITAEDDAAIQYPGTQIVLSTDRF